MSKEKFTAGKWKAFGILIMAAQEKYSFCIGSVLGGGVNNIEDSSAEANANLFAASKDMYLFISDCYDILQKQGHIDASDFCVKAEDVLNKANPQLTNS